MSDAAVPKREQNFYPLSHLPMFSQLIDEQLEHDHEQLASLQQAEGKPHILDDATVARILKLYTESAELTECYRRQLQRWQQAQPTARQRQEIERLQAQVDQLEQCHANILTLAKSFEGKTIDQVLAKTDLELAMEYLSDLL